MGSLAPNHDLALVSARLDLQNLPVSLPHFTVRPVMRSRLVGCVLLVGTVLLFSRSANYGFTNYDDPIYVANNPHVQAGLAWESIVWAFTAPNDYWHPLTWLSHMLDWQLYGSNAAGHHLTSIGWHALNAVLVFFLLRRLTGAFWTSAFSAALFAWHPLRVESVVWITERKDLMSGCFFLLTLWAYIGYTDCRSERKTAWPHYLLTLGLFLGGLMSKPMVVTLPAVLLLLDFWPLRRFERKGGRPNEPETPGSWIVWRGLFLEKIPFVALSLLVSIVTVRMQQGSGAFTLRLPLDARLFNAVVAVARYLGKFFWPFDLTVIYPHPGYWPAWAVIFSVLLIAGLSAAAWQQRHLRPWLVAGWGWFLVMLLPAIGIIQVGFQSMADRYTYLPILGLHLAIFGPKRPWPAHAGARWLISICAGVLLLANIARTWDQQSVWRDSFTLFRHAIDVTKNNDIAESFTGHTYFMLGRMDDAAQHCQRALDINPRNLAALSTLACVREQQGRFDEAIALCRTTLKFDPENSKVEYLLGSLLLYLGQTDAAVARMTSAARRNPEILSAHLQLALEEIQHGQPQNALPYYTVAFALNPHDPTAHYGSGLALKQLGREDEALVHFQAALESKPASPEINLEIGRIMLNRLQLAEAALHFQTALKFHPNEAGAHAGLGQVFFLTKRRDEAIAQWEEALRLNPNLSGLREQLQKIREPNENPQPVIIEPSRR